MTMKKNGGQRPTVMIHGRHSRMIPNVNTSSQPHPLPYPERLRYTHR
jgi:hypothetical protein